jgi:hypothetical protein
MVIRLVSVSDQMQLPDFHDVFRAILGWRGDLRFIIRVHGQEFNSFRRKTHSKALHELKLHRQEKFLYICDTLHMWEWEVRVVDIAAGVAGDQLPRCMGGRGAAPPEFCGAARRPLGVRRPGGQGKEDPNCAVKRSFHFPAELPLAGIRIGAITAAAHGGVAGRKLGSLVVA